MSIWYIKLGVVLLTLCVMGIAVGYNMALPRYSRRKVLEGTPAQTQMYTNNVLGTYIMRLFMTIGAIIAGLHILFGLIIPAGGIEYSTPESVEIWHSMDQRKAIFMVDRKIIVKSHDEIPYYAEADNLIVFYTRSKVLYGLYTLSDKDTHIIMEPELDDNVVVGDSFKEWEE